MNSILFFDWGNKNKPKFDLEKLFQFLISAGQSNRINSVADLAVAIDSTSRVNLWYSSIIFQQSYTVKQSSIVVDFMLPEDIYKDYLLDFRFENIPYFYEFCKDTIWFFDDVDVGRYDMVNTKEHPFMVGTTIYLNKKYNKDSHLRLIIKER